MQIVIDIDENVFTRLFDNGMEDYEIVNDDLFTMAKAIRKGTPLPKGHGNLIDQRELFLSLFKLTDGKICPDTNIDNFPIEFPVKAIKQKIMKATPVIEADKESEVEG